jgi:hypothetical protein
MRVWDQWVQPSISDPLGGLTRSVVEYVNHGVDFGNLQLRVGRREDALSL